MFRWDGLVLVWFVWGGRGRLVSRLLWACSGFSLGLVLVYGGLGIGFGVTLRSYKIYLVKII